MRGAEVEIVRGRAVIRGIAPTGEAELIPDGAVAHSKGRVVAVGPFETLRHTYPGALLAGGPQMLVMPGLVNAHHHLGLTPFRLGAPTCRSRPGWRQGSALATLTCGWTRCSPPSR